MRKVARRMGMVHVGLEELLGCSEGVGERRIAVLLAVVHFPDHYSLPALDSACSTLTC